MKTIIWKIWIGDKPIPEHFKQYTDTWGRILSGDIKTVTNDTVKTYLPEFDFKSIKKHFNWNNTVINHYLRYCLMYNYGGIYLDLDVEVLKDSELWKSDIPVFFAETINPLWVNNHILVCNKPKQNIYYRLARLTWWHNIYDPKIEINTGPGLISKLAANPEFIHPVYTPEYTTPWNWNEKPDMSQITDNTIAIHHFTHSWKK